jgi:diguanylate cyclase (GGDEF)-like protein
MNAMRHLLGIGARATQPGLRSPSAFAHPGKDRTLLFVLSGPQQGAVFRLPPRALIGRDRGADAAIEDESISRVHARIVRSENGNTLEDLGSVNGTALGDTPVLGVVPLAYGDHIRIGHHTVAELVLVDELEEHALMGLYESTLRDALTGLYNRRYFDDRLIAELSFAERHEAPLGLLFADLDEFKLINDAHGHQAGDLVLRVVGATIQRLMRPEDVVARFGGEEFVVIARDTGLRNAEILAERVRAQIARLRLVWNDRPLAITASVGVTAFEALSRFDSPQEMIAIADAAMYEAKRLGRDRVRVLSGSRTLDG